jgi:putative transposase
MKSELPKEVYSSKRIKDLYLKRDRRITDYFHKSSRYIVNQLVKMEVGTLVVGYNQGWKQNINLGKNNNQKFSYIPYLKFIKMLEYKCELVGIDFILNEESYTSKCSFFDNEPIQKHKIYKGNRIKRGLFVTSTGLEVNADLNGSYNIMKKVFPDAFVEGIGGVAVHPKRGVKLK